MRAPLILIVAILFAIFILNISLADEGVKRLFEAKCSECHSLDLARSDRRDKNGWREIVDRMRNYGATIDSKEAEDIINYLSNERGKE